MLKRQVDQKIKFICKRYSFSDVLASEKTETKNGAVSRLTLDPNCFKNLLRLNKSRQSGTRQTNE